MRWSHRRRVGYPVTEVWRRLARLEATVGHSASLGLRKMSVEWFLLTTQRDRRLRRMRTMHLLLGVVQTVMVGVLLWAWRSVLVAGVAFGLAGWNAWCLRVIRQLRVSMWDDTPLVFLRPDFDWDVLDERRAVTHQGEKP